LAQKYQTKSPEDEREEIIEIAFEISHESEGDFNSLLRGGARWMGYMP